MQTAFGQAVEKWKSDLILEIARRKGFRRDELEDAQQHVVLSLIHFKFDPQKANGAQERTVLAWHIERLLTQIQRTEVRRKGHAKKIHRVCGPSQFQPRTDNTQLEHERRFELGLDVRNAVSELAPMEQAVCNALAEETPRTEIAKRLGISRYEVSSIVSRIAEQFERKHIDKWVCR